MSAKLNSTAVVSLSGRLRLRSLLIFLNGFALGGLVVLVTVRYLILHNCCASGQWEPGYWELADRLLPYYLAFGGASLLLALVQIIVRSIDKRTE